MFNSTMLKSILAASFIPVLLSCGGGSSSSSSKPEVNLTEQQTKDLNTLTEGEITGFGSVYVNGVKFDTSDTKFFDDDDNAISESDLSVGMLVKLYGDLNSDDSTGSAHTIHYSPEIKGFIESLDIDLMTLSVHGQTIVFNDLTYFDDTTASSLMVDDYIEVNGHFLENGDLLATRIEKKADTDNISIKGKVANLNTTQMQFTLGALTIDYETAEFDKFTMADLADGQLVKVKGLIANLTEDVFSADKVKLYTFKAENNHQHQHHYLNGVVANLQSDFSFMLGDVEVMTNSETEIKYGTLDTLANDLNVKVKGDYNTDNQLIAKKIYIVNQVILKAEGAIEDIDTDLNTITVLGVTFIYNEFTRFDDDSEDDLHTFNDTSLGIGDYIEIKGYINSEGEHIASKISKDDEDDSDDSDEGTEFEGKVGNVTDNGFTLFGLDFTVNDSTKYEIDDEHVTQEQFFAQLTEGMLIEVKAIRNGDNYIVYEVEIEDEIEDEDDNKSSDDEKFEGKVSNISNNGFSLSGIDIIVNESTVFVVSDIDVSKDEFFNLLTQDMYLKVKVMRNGDSYIALEVEIENYDDSKDSDYDDKFEGQVSNITNDGFTVSGKDIIVDEDTKFYIYGIYVTEGDFFEQLTESTYLKVKVMQNGQSYLALEIEIEESESPG